jgi:deoxyribonuclease V
VQERLRRRVRRSPLAVSRLRRVAGCDVAIAGDRLCAVWVVFSLPELARCDQADAVVEASFPYVPGLLSFREIPALLAAYAKLAVKPEAVLCDGQGIAHPRRFGLASHLGVLLDLPSCGCAKSRLVGTHDEPGRERGAQSPLRDGEEVIGAVLRTRAEVKPLFVSAGHRMRLADAVHLVLRCGAGYRLPEPTRQADQAVGRLARSLERGSRGAVVSSPTRSR